MASGLDGLVSIALPPRGPRARGRSIRRAPSTSRYRPGLEQLESRCLFDVNFGAGFATPTGLVLNGGAAITGTRLRLTDGGTGEARSVFYSTQQNVQNFTTDFYFQLTNATADGFTFTIQGAATTAVGGGGGGLGYQGITPSVAVKFDLYNNGGEGSDSTGVYTDGAAPGVTGSMDLSGGPINLHSGDTFWVHLTYDGTTLTENITDTTINLEATRIYAINIPATIGNSTAWVGFTAATGGLTATQDILTWTYTPMSVPPSSLTWPATQLLPTFAAPVATVDAMDLRSATNQQLDLFASLQGIVNRTQPRLISVTNEQEGTFTWIQNHHLAYNLIDPWSALSKYLGSVQGIMVDDPTLPDTLDLATTIAGIKNGLVADPSLVATLQAAPYNLPILVDLRGQFTSKAQVYQYEYNNYWAQCTHRVLSGLDPNIHGHLRDYAVALQAAVFWLDPGNSSDASLAQPFFDGMPPVQGVYTGWWPNEGAGVSFGGQFGIPTYATDFFENATIYGGITTKINMPAIPPMPTLQNKIYVSLVLSDGDNAQYMQHHMMQLWNDPARGSVPIGWTSSSLASDLDPQMLNYYQSTATADDELISGPSGAGYSYVSTWTSANQNAYTTITDVYLRKAGLLAVTPWNSVTSSLGNDYATNTQFLLGVTSQTASDGTQVFDNSLPMIAFTTGYATTESSLESAISSASQGWSGTSPLFITVQGSAWNLGPTNLKNVANTLDPSRFVVVRPDELFLLYRKANALPTQEPASWSDSDVGAPALDGSALFNPSTSTWTVSGAGSDIGGTADQFHLASQNLAGDGSVVAEVTSQQNTDPSAKAGVLLRAGTAAGAAYAGVFATPGNGVVFQWRASANGATSSVTVPGVNVPVWVRLVRVGSGFSGYYSTDSSTWTQVGSSQSLALLTTLQAGLGVSAHNTGSASTATFAGVAVSAAPATALAMAAPSGASAGVAFTVTVSARNASGNVAAGYTGTITLSASDPAATFVDAGTGQPLSGNMYTFVSGDAGQHQFLVTEKKSGTLTLTASATGLTSGTASVAVTMVTINTAALPDWTVDQPGYNQTISASGGMGSLTFSAPAANLPTGLTLSSSGVLNGTPTATGSYTFTVTATDSVGSSASQSYTITINPPITLGPGSLPADTANVAYHATITAGGGTGSVTLAVSNISGAIPGLNVPNSGTGSLAISGTPTVSGTETFTITASDATGANAMQSYTIVINPAVVITTSSLPAWTAGIAYQQSIAATGGTGSLSLGVSAGTLPAGLMLSSTGVLAGTPSSAGSFTFTVTVMDTVGATGSQTFTVLINPPVSIAAATLPNWTAGVADYSQTFSASGGTGSLTFSTGGTLPPGLALSNQGVLSGTPTSAGTYSFTVTASDTIGASASQNDTITINAPVTLNPGVLSSGLVNAAYNKTIAALGGTGTVTLAVSNLSGAIPGLNVPSGGTGSLTITGTPTATGTETFTLTATDTLGSSTTVNYSITIVPATVYLSVPSSGFAGPPGGTIAGFPISINQLQDQASTNHVGLASATLALSFPTGVFNFPIGTNLASADVSLGSVPLSDMVTPGGAADWNLSASAPADGQLDITLSAKTGKTITSDNPATGGSLVLINFPIASSFNPGSADTEPISVVAANGAFHTSILGSNGSYALKPAPPYTGSVTIAPSQFSQYQVAVVGSSPVPAGRGFLVAVQAEDQYGNPLTSYSGPATVTATLGPASSGSSLPTTVAINSSGAGLFLATIPKAGSYTISVADSSQTFTGSTAPFTVTPRPAAKLAFAAQPANTPTGVPLPPVSVQITDLYGNVVSSDNSAAVTLSIASGPGLFSAGSIVTATAVAGLATFSNLTLSVPGSYTLSAVVPGLYTGPASSSFSVAPLQVVPGSFVGAPLGFSLQFNAPLLVTASTPVLYGPGFGATAPAPSLIVTTDPGNLSDRAAQVAGSVLLNAATNTLTFLATNTALRANEGSPVLPDGTYTVILRSSAATDGFVALDLGGGFLDGLGTGTPGSGDYTQTFVVNTAAAHADVVWVPATADGPGQALSAPGKNQVGGGYPIYLDDQSGMVTSVQMTLDYNPALLTVSGVTGSGFVLLSSSTAGQVVLQYSGPALPTGVQTPIGYLLASVPAGTSSNPVPYKAKDLLHLANVSLNGGTIPVATSDGLHLVAYVGDADGSGSYTSNDAVLITRVALQADTGFAAYPLVDPVIVADTDGAGFIPADAALQVNEASVGSPSANLPIPPIPSGVVFQASPYHVQALARIANESRTATEGTRKNTDKLGILNWWLDQKTLSHFRVISMFRPWPSIFADN